MSDTSLIFNILAKDKTGETFDQVSAGAAVAGAAIGAALVGGVAAAMERLDANRLLAAQLGASPEFAASLGNISGSLYAKGFGQSVADVNTALKAVWQGGLIAEDAVDADIKAVTSKVMTLSEVLGTESAAAANAVSQMLRTGLASSAEEAFDILVRGAQQGVDKTGDMLDTFNEYGTQFRKLGLDGTQAMGLLSQSVRAGARDSDVAADALKEFSIRAIDGSKATAAGFQALGLDARKMAADIAAGGPTAAAALDMTLDRLRGIKDPVAQSAAAVALFGTQAEDLGAALMAMDPSGAVAAMGQVQGAAQRASDTLHGGAGANLETFKRQLTTAFVDVIGGQVIPKLSDFVDLLRPVGGFLADNKAVVEPLAVSLGTFAGAIGVVVVATKAWAAAQTALTIAMDANPIGLIVLAVLALAAGIYYAWTHSETFRNAITSGWAAVVAFFQGAWQWLGNFFTVTIPGWFNTVVAWVTGLPARIAAGVTALVDTVINGLIALPGFLWNLFTSALVTLAGLVGSGLGLVVRFFLDLPGRIWAVLTMLWSTASQLVSAGVSAVVGFVSALPGRVMAAVQAAPGLLWGLLRQMWSQATSIVSAGVSWVVNAVTSLPGKMAGLGRDVLNGLINGIREGANRLRDLAADMASKFLDSFKSKLGIHSPSRVFQYEVAPHIASGLIAGLDAEQAAVRSAGADLAGATIAPVEAKPFRATGGAVPSQVTYQVVVHALDPRAAASAVVEAVKVYERANGSGWRER